MYASAQFADEITVLEPVTVIDAAARVTHADLRTPEVARSAAVTLIAAGMFGLAATAQVLALTEGALALVLTAPLALSAALALGVAPQVYNGRAWATLVGTGVGFGLGGAVLPWAMWAVLTGQLAPALLLAAVAALTTVMVLPFAIAPSLKVTAARRALDA